MYYSKYARIRRAISDASISGGSPWYGGAYATVGALADVAANKLIGDAGRGIANSVKKLASYGYNATAHSDYLSDLSRRAAGAWNVPHVPAEVAAPVYSASPSSSFFESRGPQESLIRRVNLHRYTSVMRPRTVARKRAAPKRGRVNRSKTMYKNFGRYPEEPLAAVEASDGRLQLSGYYGRWGEIPKAPPTGMKYFDACTGTPAGQVGAGAYGAFNVDGTTFNLGSPNLALAWNVAGIAWDPLQIPMVGCTSNSPYATVRGPGSSRSSQRIVIAAIIVQLRFFSPVVAVGTPGELHALLQAAPNMLEVEFFIDRQCNGVQFADTDVYELEDSKSSSLYYPTGYSQIHLPSVQNENRFESLGSERAIFSFGSEDLVSDNITEANPALTSDYTTTRRYVDCTYVLKDGFVVDYQSVAYGSGSGAIDQRKSMNFNGLFSSNWSDTLVATQTCYPGVSVMSRTIFYDA